MRAAAEGGAEEGGRENEGGADGDEAFEGRPRSEDRRGDGIVGNIDGEEESCTRGAGIREGSSEYELGLRWGSEGGDGKRA